MTVNLESSQANIKLWFLLHHSISAYRVVEQYFGSVEEAVQAQNLLKWNKLKLHVNHIKRATNFSSLAGQTQFEQCLQRVHNFCDCVMIEGDAYYPKQLLPYENRPPILFIQGQWQNLHQPQIAIVGSRMPSTQGKQIAYDFAYYLGERGFFITSGMAQGIDEAAHEAGIMHQRTIAVIGTGIDQIYPTQNKLLQQKILDNMGCIVSEFLPETKPLQHHFPRRNRIVSALSLGVLVAEAGLNSGSLITAKAAAEQGKVIFAIPGHIYSDSYKGCHQLIREGAILVDHPEQIIEDLAMATQWHCQQILTEQPERSRDEQIPPHLLNLFNQLDWAGQDLDHLSAHLNLSTAELTAQLMELELLGFCLQQGGLYLRCRIQ
ncbi:DNA-processing protein DprA [Acinetobacter rudis]|uniref:DNA-processing protein DprA n=1 Tax=Acinetobacter rudis TaxID=632955 RepID=A0AAW8J618_9GAMM|nr:DNA-processing protein DprA [Acinetobacter rudis]MDQ8934131.1 DNA-processing protein DprA [Acinetobacter rudis]MDQ8954415.1 DNA-processing protein DprA [Acinetobacter rudis]MDQ9016561.1 DNA-processing protein DprA [Acinetobacter rudis]